MAGPRRLIILGSGTGAWMAAAYLARMLKRLGTEIVQVPAGNEKPPPPAYAALPSLEGLHEALGFDLRDMMRACGASFRLGTLHEETGGVTAYGDTGSAFGTVPFHLAWRAHAEDVSPAAYAEHSLAALAARAGRFAPPLEGGPPGSSYSPGLHLAGPAYLRYLERAALHYGAIPAAPVAAGGIDPEAGTVRLSDGAMLGADLIIDTVGAVPEADPLAFPEMPGPFCLRLGRKAQSGPLGMARLGRVAGSRTVDIPLPSEVIRILIAHSDSAAHRASSMLRREGFEPIREGSGSLTPMRARTPWQGRLVRIGAPACCLPPVEGFELRILQAGIETLAALLPAGHPDMPEQAEYNRLMGDTFAALADFAALAFLEPGAVPADASPTLRLRLENFTSRGRILLTDGESFTRESWAGALIASGWQMRRADAHAAALPRERVRRSLVAMRGALMATSETLPDQRTWLRHAGIASAGTEIAERPA